MRKRLEHLWNSARIVSYEKKIRTSMLISGWGDILVICSKSGYNATNYSLSSYWTSRAILPLSHPDSLNFGSISLALVSDSESPNVYQTLKMLISNSHNSIRKFRLLKQPAISEKL